MKKIILAFMLVCSVCMFSVGASASSVAIRQEIKAENIELSVITAERDVCAGNANDFVDYNDSSDSDSDGDSGIFWIIWMILDVLPFPLNIIVAGIVVLVVMFAVKNKKKAISSEPTVKFVSPQSIIVTNNTDRIVNVIKRTDANFDANKFIVHSKEVFMNIQRCWSKKDMEEARTILHEDLYQRFDTQLDEYTTNGTRDVLERINVNQAYLHRYVVESQYEHISVVIDATMNEYIINETTQQIVRGDMNTRWRGRYILTFTRTKGKVSGAVTDEIESTYCPNCGAPINISSAGKCTYCGFIATTSNHDWVVTNYDVVKPGYVPNNDGISGVE